MHHHTGNYKKQPDMYTELSFERKIEKAYHLLAYHLIAVCKTFPNGRQFTLHFCLNKIL